MKFTKNTIIKEVMSMEEFKEFSHMIFPLDYHNDTNLKLDQIDYLMPWHTHINLNTTIEVLTYLKNNRDTVFHRIYSNEEIKANPERVNVGLFHFKGDENAPFGIVNAGGGFVYVGSIHESFPHALELSKKGLNGFALVYRPDAKLGLLDLSRAIEYIFDNREELGVSTDNYSLWGGSAGARLAAYVGTYSPHYFKSRIKAKPHTVVMQYTGHQDVGNDEPNTFAVIGSNDWIASPRVMETRINQIKNQGAKGEFHLYENLRHGFGLGIGTSAQGWINKAIKFWQE